MSHEPFSSQFRQAIERTVEQSGIRKLQPEHWVIAAIVVASYAIAAVALFG